MYSYVSRRLGIVSNKSLLQRQLSTASYNIADTPHILTTTDASTQILSKNNYSNSKNRSLTVAATSVRSMSSLTLDTLNPAIKKVEYAVRGPIPIRATEIQKDMVEGKKFPFEKIIKANIGDCHATGGRYITFIRQVLSICTYPELTQSAEMPSDAKERAKSILQCCGNGHSLGSYSESSGIDCLRRDAAEYISNRDGVAANPQHIFASCGASDGIRTILKMIIADPSSKLPSGVMIPIPQYPLYSAALAEYTTHPIGYYLNESTGWGISLEELERAYNECKACCTPRAIAVINPGNPTGQVLSEDNIRTVIKFARDRKLIVLADEVYQDNVYAEGAEFISFRKVLHEMSEPYKSTELASFHSASKGFMGECGSRGGYFEVTNFDEKVLVQLKKLISTNLCPPLWGQVIMDLVVKGPSKGDPSFQKYQDEKKGNLDDLKKKAKLVSELLNKIPGITCNPIQGSMYAFPRLHLPEKFIKKCRDEGKEPDEVYCMELLETKGICVVPGSGFRQEKDTYHFRTTILPPLNEIESLLKELKEYHMGVSKKYQ